MKTYQKFDAIQGLIMGFKEQIYRIDQSKEDLDPETLHTIEEQYMKAIKEVINDATGS